MYRYFKRIAGVGSFNCISYWKSKSLSNENYTPPTMSYSGIKFTGSYLKQDKITYSHKNVVNIYIVYELGASSSHSDYPTLKNCFFGAVTLTKNIDIDKYGYSGYGIGFDGKSSFHFEVVDLVKI